MLKFILSLTLVMGLAFCAIPKKCCPQNMVLLRRKSVCWDPKPNKTYPIEVLDCEIKTKIISHFLVDDDETLTLQFIRYNVTIEPGQYCIDNQTTLRDTNFINVSESVVVCSKEDIIDESVAGYCMIVSVVFLLLTGFIYALLPEMRDLQGKSLISFCVTMALGLMVLAVMKTMPYEDMSMCVLRGFLAYFFILSSFFWINAIAIQIFLSLWRPSSISYEWKDYAWYAIYSWGCPALLTFAMAVVNFIPGDHTKPGIGLMHCWFLNSTLQWHYMYSVMSILIIANICIFVYTSICLWRNTFATTHLKALKYKSKMIMRLFVLMGIPWIFEIISSLFEPSIFWVVIDILNTFQGLLIFLVLVVFRRRVIKSLYKHGWLDCFSGAIEKHLAVGDDDEQDVIEHTRELPLEDRECL